AHADSGFVFNNRLDLPTPRARKSMCGGFGIVCFSAKPRKANRDSSADRLAFLPARFCAQKENLVAPGRLPRGYLRTVYVHLAFDLRTTDLDSQETVVALADSSDSGNSEAAVELFHN